jgi:error-prone DNA polymerase
VQDEIVQGITSFALYGFPESHAASFALLVYASAFLKAHHPAAFTCALLNQWPMGFYHPATIVRDAVRHGVRVLPIDVNHSGWFCRIEEGAVRLGLRYVQGLGEEPGRRIEAARPFASVADLMARAPVSREVLHVLSEIGAFGGLGLTRREALWQATAVAREGTGLFAGVAPGDGPSPLPEMAPAERTAGGRPGEWVKIAGMVIVRQRPGTAKGFVFVTLEDETGISNAILEPRVFEAHRTAVVTAPFLVIEGRLQSQDGVVSVKAQRIRPLGGVPVGGVSHDFH